MGEKLRYSHNSRVCFQFIGSCFHYSCPPIHNALPNASTDFRKLYSHYYYLFLFRDPTEALFLLILASYSYLFPCPMLTEYLPKYVSHRVVLDITTEGSVMAEQTVINQTLHITVLKFLQAIFTTGNFAMAIFYLSVLALSSCCLTLSPSPWFLNPLRYPLKNHIPMMLLCRKSSF